VSRIIFVRISKDDQMKQQTFLRIAALWLFVSCHIVVFSGCNERRYVQTEPVRGTVTLDDSPCGNVVVTFMPIGEGEMGFARTNEKGEFLISTLVGKPESGTTVDEYRIYFSKEIEDVSKRKFGKDPETGEKVLLPNPYLLQVLPNKYLKAETSGFTASVRKGKNVFNFDLKSK
jgi:hypothetical protein